MSRYCRASDPSFPPRTSLDLCTGSYTVAGSASLLERVRVTPKMNFDDYPVALLTLFIAATGEGWPATMDALGSITGEGLSPEHYAAWLNSYFMVAYVAVARLVLINLFTAVLWANYTLMVSYPRFRCCLGVAYLPSQLTLHLPGSIDTRLWPAY